MEELEFLFFERVERVGKVGKFLWNIFLECTRGCITGS